MAALINGKTRYNQQEEIVEKIMALRERLYTADEFLRIMIEMQQ